MLDFLTVFRKGLPATKTSDHLGVITTNSSDGDLTLTSAAATYTSSWKTMATINRNDLRPLGVGILIPGDSNGKVATVNDPTAITLTATAEFGDNGSTAVSSVISKVVSLANVNTTSNDADAPGFWWLPLPAFVHTYIRMKLAAGFTGGASPEVNLDDCWIGLMLQPDTRPFTNIG